jgi:excisionase family DNA binding protein
MDENELLTISEAAMQLGVKPAGVRALERRGHLTSVRTAGNQRRFRLTDLLRLAARKQLKTNRHQRIPSEAEAAQKQPLARRDGRSIPL